MHISLALLQLILFREALITVQARRCGPDTCELPKMGNQKIFAADLVH